MPWASLVLHAVLCAPPRLEVNGEVIYEANLRALAPTHDFAALESHVSDLKAMGVTTVWLMPVYPVGKERSAGGLGSPYAVADYAAVNPEFGTRAQLRALVAKFHSQGMKVILDWVANHTSWDNPWVKDHPDWYTHDVQGHITIPPGTNWQDVADLNFDSKPMRTAMTQAMKAWLANGIDGFRCDYAEGVPTDFWSEAIRELRGASEKPLLMLAEGAKPELYDAGFDLTYDWNLYGLVKDIFAGKKSAKEFVPALKKRTKPTLRFVTNHDEYAWTGSPSEVFGSREAARAARNLLLGAPGGASLIVTGEEAGVEGKIPFFTRSDVTFSRLSEPVEDIGYYARLHALAGAEYRLTDLSKDDLVCFRVGTRTGNFEFVTNPTSQPQFLRMGTTLVSPRTTRAGSVLH